MRRPRIGAIVGLTLSLSVLLAAPAPASAIVYGQVDDPTTPLFPNVGALIGTFEGQRYVFCTGTLVTPNTFLTASHCVDADGDTMWVSFDPVIHEPVTDATNTLFQGTAHTHPDYACCGFNNTFDIAVVVLDQSVPGITPAPVASANVLGALSNRDLKAATFTTAGYGTVRETRTTAFQALSFDGTRRWATQSALALNPAWLQLSMNDATGNGGTCYGDSGGPHFLNGAIVALTVTGDWWCKATDYTYRVDTPWAREFLDDWGVPLP